MSLNVCDGVCIFLFAWTALSNVCVNVCLVVALGPTVVIFGECFGRCLYFFVSLGPECRMYRLVSVCWNNSRGNLAYVVLLAASLEHKHVESEPRRSKAGCSLDTRGGHRTSLGMCECSACNNYVNMCACRYTRVCAGLQVCSMG
jgi:hypothetical protein